MFETIEDADRWDGKHGKYWRERGKTIKRFTHEYLTLENDALQEVQ